MLRMFTYNVALLTMTSTCSTDVSRGGSVSTEGTAAAATFTLSGRITDSEGNPVAQAHGFAWWPKAKAVRTG